MFDTCQYGSHCKCTSGSKYRDCSALLTIMTKETQNVRRESILALGSSFISSHFFQVLFFEVLRAISWTAEKVEKKLKNRLTTDEKRKGKRKWREWSYSHPKWDNYTHRLTACFVFKVRKLVNVESKSLGHQFFPEVFSVSEVEFQIQMLSVN